MSISLPGRAALLLAACTAALRVAAQSAPSVPPASPASPATVASPALPAAPDPLDAKADVPAPNYASAFARWRRGDDDKTVPWREANDTVTRIGGWRTYAREAQQPDAAPAATPPVAKPAATAPDKAMPMPAGHGGHKVP